jgi:YggT family protein
MVFVANTVRLLFSIYILLIFVRVILAWLRPNMFNPIVRFVYASTDPYLRLFAGLRIFRIGSVDFTPILAFYFLYLMQELSYDILLTGHFSMERLFSLLIRFLFRFTYFILLIFIITVGLRLIFELIMRRINNTLVTIVYSLSEPAVRPIRNLLNLNRDLVVDIPALISLAILILLRILLLPRLLNLIQKLISTLFN